MDNNPANILYPNDAKADTPASAPAPKPAAIPAAAPTASVDVTESQAQRPLVDANKLYPPAPPAPEPPKTPTEWQPLEGSASVDDLVNREQSPGDRMYATNGPVPESPAGYMSDLGSVFDGLELAAGQIPGEGRDGIQRQVQMARTASAALAHELGASRNEVTDITTAIGYWNERQAPQTEDQLLIGKEATAQMLERRWGKDTDARIQLAQRTASEACKRLPWLAPLLAAGAGNDPRVITAFADIGLRNARKRK